MDQHTDQPSLEDRIAAALGERDAKILALEERINAGNTNSQIQSSSGLKNPRFFATEFYGQRQRNSKEVVAIVRRISPSLAGASGSDDDGGCQTYSCSSAFERIGGHVVRVIRRQIHVMGRVCCRVFSLLRIGESASQTTFGCGEAQTGKE